MTISTKIRMKKIPIWMTDYINNEDTDEAENVNEEPFSSSIVINYRTYVAFALVCITSIAVAFLVTIRFSCLSICDSAESECDNSNFTITHIFYRQFICVFLSIFVLLFNNDMESKIRSQLKVKTLTPSSEQIQNKSSFIFIFPLLKQYKKTGNSWKCQCTRSVFDDGINAIKWPLLKAAHSKLTFEDVRPPCKKQTAYKAEEK